jgi:hypothetical protein
MTPPRPPAKPPLLPPTVEKGLKPTGDPAALRPRPPVPARPPARHEDGPPLTPHRELVHIGERPAAPESMPAPPSRKDSPAGGISVQGKGWKITMPHVALVAVLTTIGGWFGSKVVSKGESAEVSDVLTEVRLMRKDVKDLSGDVADVRDEQRKARSNNTKILNYAEDTFTPIVASLRKLGVKLDYSGREPEEVEFSPAPMAGSKAPPIQPKATLPERPSL